jgi:hypothetical protein
VRDAGAGVRRILDDPLLPAGTSEEQPGDARGHVARSESLERQGQPPFPCGQPAQRRRRNLRMPSEQCAKCMPWHQPDFRRTQRRSALGVWPFVEGGCVIEGPTWTQDAENVFPAGGTGTIGPDVAANDERQPFGGRALDQYRLARAVARTRICRASLSSTSGSSPAKYERR